nr:hypothetical protein [Herbaspirillum sp. ASV7]
MKQGLTPYLWSAELRQVHEIAVAGIVVGFFYRQLRLFGPRINAEHRHREQCAIGSGDNFSSGVTLFSALFRPPLRGPYRGLLPFLGATALPLFCAAAMLVVISLQACSAKYFFLKKIAIKSGTSSDFACNVADLLSIFRKKSFVSCAANEPISHPMLAQKMRLPPLNTVAFSIAAAFVLAAALLILCPIAARGGRS